MKENRKDFTIKLACAYCHKKVDIQVNEEDFIDWQTGTYAQDAFPYLSHAERNVLIKHMCISCQESIYGKFKEEEYEEEERKEDQ